MKSEVRVGIEKLREGLIMAKRKLKAAELRKLEEERKIVPNEYLGEVLNLHICLQLLASSFLIISLAIINAARKPPS